MLLLIIPLQHVSDVVSIFITKQKQRELCCCAVLRRKERDASSDERTGTSTAVLFSVNMLVRVAGKKIPQVASASKSPLGSTEGSAFFQPHNQTEDALSIASGMVWINLCTNRSSSTSPLLPERFVYISPRTVIRVVHNINRRCQPPPRPLNTF